MIYVYVHAQEPDYSIYSEKEQPPIWKGYKISFWKLAVQKTVGFWRRNWAADSKT